MLSGDPVAGFVVVLPKFSKELSGTGLNIQLDSTTRFGSCAFDLAERLGLVLNPSNKILCEAETIPVCNVVHNSVTYCARISRHFLVHLISEHVQELWQVGDRTFVSTNIGQFTLYTYEGRSLLHFDGSTRISTATDTGLCLPGFSGSKGSVSGGEPAPISAGCLGADCADGRSH